MCCLIAAIVDCIVGCASGAPDGQSLHVLECDTETGSARIVQTVRGIQDTTYFQLDASGGNLYSFVGRRTGGKNRGSLARFPVKEGRIGEMEVLAALPCEPPCHISLSPDCGRIAFAAYASATAGTYPVAGGALKTVVLADEGLGPNVRRQEKAHAHFVFFTPDGSKTGVIDLGADRIFFFNPATMEPYPEMTVRTDPGDGPRHAVWSDDGRFLYVVNELGNSVIAYAFDGSKFCRIGKWSTLPAGAGESYASAIKLADGGNILLASNRGFDSIAIFRVDRSSGLLELRNIAKIAGSFPRDFELMPGEKFLVAGHERSNEIRIYRFDKEACTLEPVGDPIPAWHPLCFKFLPGKTAR